MITCTSIKCKRILKFVLFVSVSTFVIQQYMVQPSRLDTSGTKVVETKRKVAKKLPPAVRHPPGLSYPALDPDQLDLESLKPDLALKKQDYVAKMNESNVGQLSGTLLEASKIDLSKTPTSILREWSQSLSSMKQYLPSDSIALPPEEPDVPDPLNEVTGGPETNILRWNGKSWTKLQHFCVGNLNLKRTVLKSPEGNAIVYIHDLKDDKYVSGSLKRQGLWDLPDVTAMINNLRSDPDLGFIDIGSHVGTFSLVAALMGNKVVAVDPLVSNVLRFCRSVQANAFTDKITIFFTAISNSYKKVSFQRDIGNIGGTRIKEAPSGVNTSNIYDPNFIDTVLLDDLLPHIPFKRAFIKMDVEEHEYEVVTSGVRFFREIDVRGILMEWMWQKNGPNGLKLRDYLLGLHFKPYFPDGSTELNAEFYKTWPNDVLWKKV